MAFQPRGGFPKVIQVVAATDGSLNGSGLTAPAQVKYVLPAATVSIAFKTDVPVKVYFTRADFEADTGALLISDVYDGPIEARALWFRGVSGPATVQVAMILKG